MPKTNRAKKKVFRMQIDFPLDMNDMAKCLEIFLDTPNTQEVARSAIKLLDDLAKEYQQGRFLVIGYPEAEITKPFRKLTEDIVSDQKKTFRKQFDLPEKYHQMLKALTGFCGTKDLTKILRIAIGLFYELVQERLAGRKILLQSPDLSTVEYFHPIILSRHPTQQQAA